ncbi:oxidoreductase [Acidomonas methanolica]|uniref:oxidoreductase n=1 Tax=Acidomonas methanolica TaxID=437 RepID=UPI00211A1290|nr:oxidoreductase [Acidomonas methanolica]MCQ9155951.1 SDR family NAD(P)-dependent oxidoreductase [Acidomonas methanolica]
MMKTWFITGISGGLGYALTEAVLSAGGRVVGTSRQRTAASDLQERFGAGLRVIALDLTDEDAVREAVRAAEAETGTLDVVVNNAGYGLTGAIEETSLQQVRDIFEVNVLGPLAVIQAALPAMRARRSGHIVNITSVSGLAAWAGTGIYGATKFAMECIGRTLALEVEPLGVKVINVAPGGLRTGFAGNALEESRDHIADYAETAHQARMILTGHRGEEPNDPVLAARAIMKAVEARDPPRCLLLGEDAFRYAQREIAFQHRDFTHWHALTVSVGIKSGG